MSFRFIADHADEWPVAWMCEALEVSASGYYAWAARPDSPIEQWWQELVEAIEEVHAEVKGRYGSPRMAAELNARGVGPHPVPAERGDEAPESRKVPVHPRLRAVLAALPSTHRPCLLCAAPSRKYPAGDRHISVKRLNEQFTRLVGRLGMPVGRNAGFVIHSLRHFFETHCVNAGIPQRVIDTWLGHRSDKSMAAVYYRLRDEEAQAFVGKVPFGTGEPAAGAGITEVG